MQKKKADQAIVFGMHPVIESLESDRPFSKILIQRDTKNDRTRELKEKAGTRGVPVQKVPKEKLDRYTRKNHQGVVGLVSPVPYQDLWNLLPGIFEEGRSPLFLFLDKLTDVRNFGAVCRTAECCGVDAVILPSNAGALLNPDAVRTSAGALNRLPVCRVNDPVATLSELRNSGLRVVACSEKGEHFLHEASLAGPAVIIVGAEDTGISAPVMEVADEVVKIPMAGRIASLNVSVAAGMAMYECVRQRALTPAS